MPNKTADLERARNNQRRCRARRKDYIAKLESRIREYENFGDRSAGDDRLRHLSAENQNMRRLLHSLGLDEDFIDAYSKAANAASVLTHSVFAPNPVLSNMAQVHAFGVSKASKATEDFISPYEETAQFNAVVPFIDETRLTTWENIPDMILQEDFEGTNPLGRQDLTSSQAPSPKDNNTALLVSDTFAGEALLNMDFTSSDASDSSATTLCSVALAVVMKNNRKGYSPADLDSKLRVGYRCAVSSNEGCRIDNRILFTVLAEIS